ncbi:MAG: hypothetical protein ABIG71_04545 [Candidatus Uhrbacteria bacterium]
MRNLLRFFHFHDGTLHERLTKIISATLAALFISIGAAAMTVVDAADTPSELHFASTPCSATASSGKVHISWSTTNDTESNYVMFGSDATYGRIVIASSGYVHDARVPVDSLPIHFRVQSMDELTGEVIFSGDCVVTEDQSDITAPNVVDAHITTMMPDAVSVIIATDEPTDILLTAYAAADETAITESASAYPSTLHHLTMRELVPNTTYQLAVDTIDASGNSSARAENITFRTPELDESENTATLDELL